METLSKPKGLPALSALALAGLACFSSVTLAGNSIYTFASSIENPQDVGTGRVAHTHAKALILEGSIDGTVNSAVVGKEAATVKAAAGSPPYAGYTFQTPASISCILGLVPQTNNCNSNKLTTSVSGGSKAIAIVDAYNYPNAATDLAKFSTQFGLPAANLTVVYASGSKPANDPMGWEVEEALDLQWAHAMAPNAKLYLVEAASPNLSDLLVAINVANGLVSAAGGGQVSMSWGASEFYGQSSYDSYFTTANVEYFASSGDVAGVNWPCVSKNVVCVGGTTLRIDATGNFIQSVVWLDTGGGISAYNTKPAFQSTLTNINARGVPDISLPADPMSGGWVYYTPSSGSGAGWWIIGGTSWAAPSAAGITNTAKDFQASGTALLTSLYGNTKLFTDVSAGWCGYGESLSAGTGWDQCTGLGSFLGLP